MKLYLDDIDEYVDCKKSFWLKKRYKVHNKMNKRASFFCLTAIAIFISGEFLCILL